MKRWHQMSGTDCANSVISIVENLASMYRWRLEADRMILRRVEPSPVFREIDNEDTGFRVRRTKSLAESVQADIVGRQRPKPVALTSGAEWQVRRRALRLDKFVLGQFNSQGFWQVAEDLILDACYSSVGMGVMKIVADTESHKICYERVLARNIYVDPREWRAPLNYFQRSAWDKDLLIELYPEHANAINAAQPVDNTYFEEDVSGSEYHRAVEQVFVFEAWRVRRGEKNGKYAVCVPGATLHEEEWESTSPPFAFFTWTKARERWGGVSLADEMRELEAEFNGYLRNISENMALRTTQVHWVPRGSVIRADLTENDNVQFIEYDGSSPPTTQMPPVLSPGEFEVAKWVYGLSSELSGISDMMQTGNKPGGVTAASALRTLRDTGSRRQAMRVTAFEQLVKDAYRRTVEAARMLAKDDPEFSSNWPGSGFLKTIKWSESNLEDSQYELSIEASSMLTEEPGGRLALLQEMFSAGLISGEEFKRNSNNPDIEQLFSRSNAEFDWNEILIDRILDLDEESETPRPADFDGPEGFLTDLPGALVQFGAAYFEAKKQGAPEFNLNILRGYIEALVSLQKQRMTEDQAMSAKMVQHVGGGAGAPPPPPPGA